MKHKKILIIILLITSFLRLWKLSEVPVSLFGDELDVGYHAYSILKTGKDYSGNSWPLHFQSLAEWRTPLYLYSAVPTVALFGISPLGVRLPAAVFGILGVWGIYLLVGEFVRYGSRVTSSKTKKLNIDHQSLAIVSSFLLAISPWHIQYSRAAFEVTQLIAFLVFGLYFFFRSINDARRHPEIAKRVEGFRRDSIAKRQASLIASLQNDRSNGKWLWLSVVFLVATPWIYSTAKLFTPVLFIFLFFVWRKEILGLSKKYLTGAAIAGLIVGLPIVYSTIFSGGSQRFSYISVFTDPTREAEIGVAREIDARVRSELQVGLQPSLSDKLFHNKFTFWGKKVTDNYLQSFSTDFLFINGDPNTRHSINKMGQFYKIELLALLLGLVFFFSRFPDKKIKALIAFWILAGVFPAAMTRNGGNHATRLILILPPLIFLISFGLVEACRRLKGVACILLITFYILLFSLSFIFYQHNFWVHNPFDSERWWHSGWKEAIQSIKAVESDYDRVVISTANEPPWIFFAAWYQYPPDRWHADFPIGNDVDLEGFGKVSHIDKFYFGTPVTDESFYSWDKIIDGETLYLADTKEVNVNLIREPDRTPPGLKLVKAISFPSGEPAFYLFSGKTE